MPLLYIQRRSPCQLIGLMMVIVFILMVIMPAMVPCGRRIPKCIHKAAYEVRQGLQMDSKCDDAFIDHQPSDMAVAPSHFKSGSQTAGQAALETRLFEDVLESSNFTDINGVGKDSDAYIVSPEDGESEMNTMARGYIEGENHIAPSAGEISDAFESRFAKMRRR